MSDKTPRQLLLEVIAKHLATAWAMQVTLGQEVGTSDDELWVLIDNTLMALYWEGNPYYLPMDQYFDGITGLAWRRFAKQVRRMAHKIFDQEAKNGNG